MAKFNTAGSRTRVSGPVTTATTRSGRTHQGGSGYDRDDKSELFLLGVSMFVGEGAFYESGDARAERFKALVRELAISDPEWLVGFIGWLRDSAQIRTAPLVAAVEMTVARSRAKQPGFSRQAVAAALSRADEPGEMLAYYTTHYGKHLPMPLKRGIADVLPYLYSQRQALKRADRGAWKFADVIELAHPKVPFGPVNVKPEDDLDTKLAALAHAYAKQDERNDLFTYLLDKRHHAPAEIRDSLWMLRSNADLWELTDKQRRALLKTEEGPLRLRRAGFSWQDMSAWIPGEWTAAMWEAVIPGMSYQELLMNLRNFDKAGIGRQTMKAVQARLVDVEEIKRSRMLPMRFLSAHRATSGNLRWGAALEEALQSSLVNVPELKGSTLILVDRSGSMFARASERSELTFADTAALFGSALALRAERATLVQYGTTSRTVRFSRGDAVLQMISRFTDLGGTNTAQAVHEHFRKGGHNRVVVVTDEQHGPNSWYWAGDPYASIPYTVPTYTWNLAGYKKGGAAGTANRHFFGGFSPAAFSVFDLLERGTDAPWPWEHGQEAEAA